VIGADRYLFEMNLTVSHTLPLLPLRFRSSLTFPIFENELHTWKLTLKIQLNLGDGDRNRILNRYRTIGQYYPAMAKGSKSICRPWFVHVTFLYSLDGNSTVLLAVITMDKHII
jgi:hypothetical protein